MKIAIDFANRLCDALSNDRSQIITIASEAGNAAVAADQYWHGETTAWTFGDNSVLYYSHLEWCAVDADDTESVSAFEEWARAKNSDDLITEALRLLADLGD